MFSDIISASVTVNNSVSINNSFIIVIDRNTTWEYDATKAAFNL